MSTGRNVVSYQSVVLHEYSYANTVNKVREVLFSSKFLEETTKAQNPHFLFMNPA